MRSFVGIDWSEKRHDVRVHNDKGACLARFQVPHSLQGFEKLEKRLKAVNPRAAACLVGIETQENLLVDFLCERGYPLYVVAPGTVNSNRGRHRASGAKDDDGDAYLLADILRTDRHRLVPWRADGALVRQMRLWLHGIDELTNSIVRANNRLRANLLRYYPQCLQAFENLQSHIALAFLQTYAAPTQLQALSYEDFWTFCRRQGYRHYRLLPEKYAHLQTPAPQVDPAIVTAHAAYSCAVAQQLQLLTQQKKKALQQVTSLFVQHEDAYIFDSLPGSGKLLAPKLLVMFGDHRDRYPQPTILQAIAGACPITRRSGKSQLVLFRRACNRRYRATAQQFAMSSLVKSPWAAGYFYRAKERGHGNSHALRALANRWLRIIWAIWQKREPYDESYHLQQLHHRRQPQPSTSA